MIRLWIGGLSLLAALILALGSIFMRTSFWTEAGVMLVISLIAFASLYRGWGRVAGAIGRFIARNAARAGAGVVRNAPAVGGFIANHWAAIWAGLSIIAIIVSVVVDWPMRVIALCIISLVLALVTAFEQWGNAWQHRARVWLGLSVIGILLSVYVQSWPAGVASVLSLILAAVTVFRLWIRTLRTIRRALTGHYGGEAVCAIWGLILTLIGVGLYTLPVRWATITVAGVAIGQIPALVTGVGMLLLFLILPVLISRFTRRINWGPERRT